MQAVEAAPEPAPLDDVASAAVASGAPTWWAADHTGGRGRLDVPANLSVVQDPVYYAHPALQGLEFERVPGNPTLPPTFTGNGHGTALVSMAAAQGPVGCTLCQAADAGQKGTAFGVSKVLDPDGAYSEFDWPLGISYGRFDAGLSRFLHQAGAPDPAQVLNYSRGGDVAFDDDLESQGWDATVDAHGVTATVAAGNSGPSPQTVNNPAIAYNVIAVGAYCCSGSSTHTTDTIASFSSRGPTAAGRKKPDLVAPGDGQLADVLYNSTGKLWKYQEGTSFSAPQAAAAAILLAGAGIRDPKVVKAILIDSARQGRSAPGAAWGTQTGWQPDFGWGELDLDAAYRERLNFARGAVPGNGARFFKATSQAAGDRATLVWHRRVADCVVRQQGCTQSGTSGWRVYTLSNLDLAAYSATNGSEQSTSASAIDNVEQVRTSGAGDVVYKVSAGGVDTPQGEPFALAATRPLTELVTPQPEVGIATSAPAPVPPGRAVTVTATVANPSPDLAAPATDVTLDTPPGVDLVGGARRQQLGTLPKHGAPGATATASWTVRGSAHGIAQLSATATTSVYGSTLTGSATRAVEVDAAGPAVTLAAPAGATTDPALALAWSGSDPAGVTGYDVEVATDDGPFTPWLSDTSATGATYTASSGGRYRFRVRARDGFGNESPFSTSDQVAVVPPQTHGPSTTPTAPLATPNLSLAAVKRRGAALVVRGRAHPGLVGRIALTWSARARGRRLHAHTGASVVRGRFTARIGIPREARRLRAATLALAFRGDRSFSASSRRFRIHWR